MVQRGLHFDEKLVGHFSREAVADEDALDDEIFAIGRHGVGRNQPAALAQSIGEVVEREARGCGVFQFPAQAGDPAVAVVNDLEGPELGDLFGEIAAQLRTLRLDFAVALFAEAQEVVVLADDFAAGPREVEREGGHVAAEVVDVEDQLFGKIVLLAPQRPANAQRRETKFMAGSVDGFYPRQAEVPEKVRLHEGREESAAGSVDVDGDVEAGLGLQLVERQADLVDRLELQGERNAEGNDDADGVFVAALERLLPE